MDEAGEPRGYIICGEPRCGSTFLCQLLRATGLLGQPREVFAGPEARRTLGRDPNGGLATLIEGASTPNGVYGFKVFTYQFDTMANCRWMGRLPRPHFVHLQRRDLLAQAISLMRAHQTHAFSSWRPIQGEPHYDRRAIAKLLPRLAQNDSRWRAYFARNGIEPLTPTYEELVANPQGAVTAIAATLSIDEVPPVDPSLVENEIQRDELSEEWRRRFVAEARDLDWLDGWPFPSAHARWRQLRGRFELLGSGQ